MTAVSPPTPAGVPAPRPTAPAPNAGGGWRGLRRGLEQTLALGLAAAALAAWLPVRRHSLVSDQGPLSFGLALWLWAVPFYMAAAGAVQCSSWAVGRAAGGAVLARGLRLAVALAFGGHVARRLWLDSAAAHETWNPAALAAVAAWLLSLLAWSWDAGARGGRRTVLALAVALHWLALRPHAAEPSRTAAETSATRPARLAAPPLLLFGIDGGDWDHIEPLLARGDLPALQTLRERGVWGELSTQRPTLSPVVWTTIATGRSPKVHGVRGFVTERLRGVEAPLPELTGPGAWGWAWLQELWRRHDVIRSGPISSDVRRVPALWNLASRERSPVNVVNWWATWPAEPVFGHLVSERVYYRPEPGIAHSRVTYPPELLASLAPLLMRRDQVGPADAQRFFEVSAEEFAALRTRPARERTLEAQFTYFYAMTESDRRVALHLTNEGRRRYGRAPDLCVLFRLVDMMGHTSLRYSELVEDHLGASPAELRRYGRVISEAYRTLDRALGELVAAFGPEAHVVVVSDHGFELLAFPGEERVYDHRNGAAGMFLAAGPALRPGRVQGLGVLDVLPLVAELKGYPLAADLEGRPASVSLGPLFVPWQPVVRVASYGPRDEPSAALGGSAGDQELLERLRALGYLR